MGLRFAKVDADLDSNPKIRAAGRGGREVFLFVLRRNAGLDRPGRIPEAYVAPWYLAEQLIMSAEEAADGLSRCVTAGLVTVADGYVWIKGWDEGWSKAPQTEAARKARQRERERETRKKPRGSARASRDVTTHDVTDRDCPDSHTLDQTRSDENRLEENTLARASRTRGGARTPSGDHAGVIAAFDARYAARYGSKPTWGGKQGRQVAGLLKHHTAEDLVRRIGILFDSPPAFLAGTPPDFGTLVQHVDKLVAPSRATRTNQPTPLELQFERVAMLEREELERQGDPCRTK